MHHRSPKNVKFVARLLSDFFPRNHGLVLINAVTGIRR